MFQPPDIRVSKWQTYFVLYLKIRQNMKEKPTIVTEFSVEAGMALALSGESVARGGADSHTLALLNAVDAPVTLLTRHVTTIALHT